MLTTLLVSLAASSCSLAQLQSIIPTSLPVASDAVGDVYVFGWTRSTTLYEYDRQGTHKWIVLQKYGLPFTVIPGAGVWFPANGGSLTFLGSWPPGSWFNVRDSSGTHDLQSPGNISGSMSSPSNIGGGSSVMVTFKGSLYERPLSVTSPWNVLGNPGAILAGRPAISTDFNTGKRWVLVRDEYDTLYRLDDTTGNGNWQWVTPSVPEDINHNHWFDPLSIGPGVGSGFFVTAYNWMGPSAGYSTVWWYHRQSNGTWLWDDAGIPPTRNPNIGGYAVSPAVLITGSPNAASAIAVVVQDPFTREYTVAKAYADSSATWHWTNLGAPSNDQIKYNRLGLNPGSNGNLGVGEGTLTSWNNSSAGSITVKGNSGNFWQLEIGTNGQWTWKNIGHP